MDPLTGGDTITGPAAVAGAVADWQVLDTAPPEIADDRVLRVADDAVVHAVDRATFVQPGRTAWVPLDDRRALKLKGVGLWRGAGTRPTPPTTEAYTRPMSHVGFTDTGELRLIDSAPAPVGGITVSRAANEFNAALDMWRAGATSVRPVRRYRLAVPPLRFPPGKNGEPLGAVVTLLPTAYPQRVDTLFRRGDHLGPADQEFVAAVRQGRCLLTTLVALAAGYGRALRDFTGAGCFRHSGSVDNWAVVPGADVVLLTDLDSTRRLTEVPAARRPLEILRDLVSGVFGLAAALMAPSVGTFVTESAAAGMRCFAALVAGYVAEEPGEVVDQAMAPFHRYWAPLAHRSWAGLGTHPRGTDRAIWMDRGLAYCLLLRGLARVYDAGDLRRFGGELDTDRLAWATGGFLGPARSRRLEMLLAEEL